MILYYAVGGGMGHLTRASAILHTLQVPLEQVKILTASPFATLYFKDLPVLSLPAYLNNDPELYMIWLKQQCKKYNFTEIWVDSFPSGILGELYCLQDFPLKWTYFARLLHWEHYKGLIKYIPDFQKIVQLETLESEHQAFLNTWGLTPETIDLQYPVPQNDIIPYHFTSDDWLIVHSEPAQEVEELLAYAHDQATLEGVNPNFCVCSPIQKLNTTLSHQIFDLFPSHLYFGQVGRIFTACGFNSMMQTLPFRNKHHFLPFPRRFDNQFFRARVHRGM